MRIRVLGVVGIETDDGAVVEARGNGRVLLAVLAMTPNRTVPTDVLIDSVWGEAGAARSTLHVEVHACGPGCETGVPTLTESRPAPMGIA